MQLTNGKIYTFVGTSGGYSNSMCVTAGMFEEAAITSWVIVVEQLTIGGGQIYVGFNQNYSTNNTFTYFAPHSLGVTPEDMNKQQTGYTSSNNNSPFRLNVQQNEQLLTGNVNLGFSGENFRLGSLTSGTYKLNGSNKNVYTTTLGNVNTITYENITIGGSSSSASSLHIISDLYAYDYKNNQYDHINIIYGNNEDGSDWQVDGITLKWHIYFPNFNSDAQLYSGQLSYGKITTTETNRVQRGNTLYRYVTLNAPTMYFIQHFIQQ